MSRPSLAALLVLVLAAGACHRGGDAPPAPSSSSAPAPSAPSTDVEPHHELHLPPPAPTVHVSFDGKSADVALASVAAADTPGAVPFPALWKAAFPAIDPAPLHFDVVGADGFRPMSRAKCTRLLTGAEIAGARIVVASHDLVLADAASLPGCYHVKGVASIEASR